MTISKQEIKQNKSRLRKELTLVSFGVLVTIMALAVATFAWYVYYTQSSSNSVRMSAGSTVKLEIAKTYDGDYSSAVDLATFKGSLNPVSTDKIQNGFLKVYGFTDGSETQPKIVANLFGAADASDYFNTSVFVRTNGAKQGVYIAGFVYDDSEDAKLMSTAMRVGIVVHEPGNNQKIAAEYIFELNSIDHNPNPEYNTEHGEDGYVLDSTDTTGSGKVVDFRNLIKTKDNFVEYNSSTGEVKKLPASLKLFDLVGAGDKKPGESVQVDIYLWMEGCDADCTGSLGSLSLKNFAVMFASIAE